MNLTRVLVFGACGGLCGSTGLDVRTLAPGPHATEVRVWDPFRTGPDSGAPCVPASTHPPELEFEWLEFELLEPGDSDGLPQLLAARSEAGLGFRWDPVRGELGLLGAKDQPVNAPPDAGAGPGTPAAATSCATR